MSESTIEFPGDLLQAAQRSQQAEAELEALERPKYTEDYPEGMAEREAALMEERRRLAEQMVVHPFWESLTGPDLVAARTALKQAAKAALSKRST